MRKSYVATLVLLVTLLAFSTAALATDLNIQPKLELSYVFGKAEYSDDDDNGFDDATLNGFRFSGQAYVWDKIGLTGSFFSGSNAEVEDELELSNSIYDIAVVYGVVDGVDIGAGWLFYNFEAENETNPFKENRDYSGFSLVALVDMPVQDGFAVTGSAKFAPSMNVKDKVKGDFDDPAREAEVEYDGSYMEAQLGVKYAVYENVSIGAGYRYTKLKGDGADHDDYRFLDHEYTNSGFFAGVSVSF